MTRQTLVDTESVDGDARLRRPPRARAAGSAARSPGSPDAGTVVAAGQAALPGRRQAGHAAVRRAAGVPAAARRASRAPTSSSSSRTWRARLHRVHRRRRVHPATADAVREWQDDLGLTETGRVELGRVVFAAGRGPGRQPQAAVGDARRARARRCSPTPAPTRLVTVELDVGRPAAGQQGRRGDGRRCPTARPVAGKVEPASQTVIEAGERRDRQRRTDEDRGDRLAGRPDGRSPGSTRRAVDVAFTAAERAGRAHRAGRGAARARRGRLRRRGRRRRRDAAIVAVKTGLFADGRVEVTGAGARRGHDGRGCRR